MKNAKTIRIVVLAAAIGLSATQAFSQDVCSDSYLAQQIQPEADKMNALNGAGECQIARAGIKFYSKSIKLVNKCLTIQSLREYKTTLQGLLQQAKDMEASFCG
ncbi:hypothetical protein K9B32_16395 [Rhizobium sp. 3T7]|uniref:hypothetical protein n=1 Tax=Rhizobium sp. 3T7 TaxID=2874922 RepID=UPI001CCD4F5E|nr:hypothetical protein [Rhizobium sp. 3T7]MBZ9791686.1 hypothetical protein [Rhizobium sp. 3T7]